MLSKTGKRASGNTGDTPQRVLWWSLVGLEIYSFIGYPLLLLALTAFRNKPVRKSTFKPSVTVIVPAYNEEAILAEKLESILAQCYPPERLEIIVVSDGSTDRTVDVARRYSSSGVRVLDLPRAGKARALNQAAASATSEILVFTDANAILAPNALDALMSNFADSSVGGVSANEKRLQTEGLGSAGRGERLYWDYDKWLKQSENKLGSIVSASGSMYAIRRALFSPIQDPAATDDFSISTQVVREGHRLVFEPEAVTFEPSIATGEAEFRRKTRIVTRGLRSVYSVRDLLAPWNSGVYSLQLWSHKIIRRMSGFVAISVFLVSLTLAHRRFYRLALAGQIIFYSLAIAGWLGQANRWGRKPWFYVPYYFCLSNLAAMIGVYRFVSQTRLEVWETKRDA